MDSNLLLTVLSIIIALGMACFSIYISLQTSRRTDDTLREILKSSKVTESTTTQTIPQFVDIIKTQLTQGVYQRTKEGLPTLSEEDRGTVQNIAIGVASEISKTLESMKKTSSPPFMLPKMPRKKQEFDLPERFQKYDWYKFLTRLNEQERNNKFVGAKRFREEILAGNIEDIEAVQFAIDNQIVLKYSLTNPKNPLYSTTAIKLNRGHPLVIQYLGG